MYDYYCKNCNNIVGEWNNKYYNGLFYCNFFNSKKFNTIRFLDCKKCNKFVGIFWWNVCVNCFGKNQIFGEKNLFKWFLKYEKINQKSPTICKICNKNNFRCQFWFFEELTFYK